MQTNHLSLAAGAVIVLSLTLLLTACGGGAGGGEATAVMPVAATPVETAATPPATPGPTVPAATALPGLSLDLANLPNYAAPVLPAHYNAGVLADDNTPGINRATDAAATLGRVPMK